MNFELTVTEFREMFNTLQSPSRPSRQPDLHRFLQTGYRPCRPLKKAFLSGVCNWNSEKKRKYANNLGNEVRSAG